MKDGDTSLLDGGRLNCITTSVASAFVSGRDGKKATKREAVR